jgi:NADH-quinone oxidoreductase subunit N
MPHKLEACATPPAMKELELLKLAAPEAALTVTVLAVLAVQMVRQGHAKGHILPGIVSSLGLVIAMFFTAGLPAHATMFGGMIVSSPLNTLFKLVCLALALFTVLIAQKKCPLRHVGEYHALILLATIGLLLLVGSEELLMIFIGLELAGLSLYMLAGFDKDDRRSAEAGLKYFLFGSTASAFTLYGLSLVYGACGSLQLAHIDRDIASYAPLPPLFAAGLVMTLIGFAFKVAAAPFHLWAPDAYQGAPVPSAAFIASGSKVASFVALGKILLIAFGSVSQRWSAVIVVLAAASIVVGNLVALAQGNVRRLLAYSAVAHAGYTLLGLIGGRGFDATLFYTATYAVTVLGAFAVVAQVKDETGGADIANFAGLRARSPFLAACLTVFLLSLAGLPPLVGFFGKFYVFAAALRQPGTLWLVALALAGSLVSLYYYLAVLRAALIADAHEDAPPIRIDFLQKVVLLVLAALVVGLGIFPDALLRHITGALAASGWF